MKPRNPVSHYELAPVLYDGGRTRFDDANDATRAVWGRERAMTKLGQPFTVRELIRVRADGTRHVVATLTSAALAKWKIAQDDAARARQKACKRCGGFGMPQFVQVNGGHCAACGAKPRALNGSIY